MNNKAYTEIERKWEIDQLEMRRIIKKLTDEAPIMLEVTGDDAYFLGKAGYIYRYRNDAHHSELTVKTHQEDAENRTEINLDMEHNEIITVIKFFSTLGMNYKGTISKTCFVYKYPHAEVSVYEAHTSLGKKYFVEIEAYSTDYSKAIEDIVDLEVVLGLNSDERSKDSLYDIMLGAHQ